MDRKAQGSTEYIALMAIALVVMLVAVSFLVVEPQFAYSAKKGRSDEYWANARPFAVKDYAINQERLILEVQNADPVSLTVRDVKIKGVSINFSRILPPYNESATPMCGGGACGMPMAPGQNAIIVTDNLSIANELQKLCFSGDTFQEGRYYEANLSISYSDSSGGESDQASNVPLIGQCMRIAINQSACVQNGVSCSVAGECCTGSCSGGRCACKAVSAACGADSQCCSSLCSGGTCACKPDAASCSAAGECCTGDCTGGVCTSPSGCWENGISCSDSSQCCTGLCSGGACACNPNGNTCASDQQCCGVCNGNLCASCKSNGITCSNESQCCSGICTGGLCAAPPTCLENGISCTSDLQCCGFCNGNLCASCKDLTVPCTSAGECCSGTCFAGACASCVGSGGPCASDSQCCLAVPYCSGGACVSCVVNGNPCTLAAQCCSGACNAGMCAATSSLSISCPAPTGTVGFAYSSSFSASGGSGAGYNYSITSGSLPANLTRTGASIAGTPSTVQASTFNAQVTDSAGNSNTQSCTITISTPSLSIACPAATGTVGSPYSSSAVASGGTGTYTSYSKPTGSLPASLSLSAGTGAVTGTPSVAGTSTFTVGVADSANDTATSPSCSIDVACAGNGVACSSDNQCCTNYCNLASGTCDTALACMYEGGQCPYEILGIPIPCCVAGPYCISGACATCKPRGTACSSSSECCAAAPYCNGVACTDYPAISITCPASTGTVGTAYSSSISASGGSGTGYTYSTGTLPANLSRSGAAITGTPSTAGTTTFTVSVTDSASNSGSKSCSITISPAPCPAASITTSSLPSGTVGTPYSTTVSASGGSGFSWSASGLPFGSINPSTGVISGTPASSGTSSVIVSVSNSCGSAASKALSLAIYPAISITCPASTGTAGTPYSSSISASGGSGSGYTYSAGTLPSGLSLASSTGAVTGTPSTVQTSTFTATVTDGASNTASNSCTITISCGLSGDPCTSTPQCCTGSGFACGTNSQCGLPPGVDPPIIG